MCSHVKEELIPVLLIYIVRVCDYVEMCLRVPKRTLSRQGKFPGFSAISDTFQTLLFFSKMACMRDTFFHSSMWDRTCALK